MYCRLVFTIVTLFASYTVFGEIMPEKIQQLETFLQHKSFQELTPAERALVLEMVGSESEYDKLQIVEDSLAKWYGTSIESLQPSPGVLPFLERRLSAENPAFKKHPPVCCDLYSITGYPCQLRSQVGS